MYTEMGAKKTLMGGDIVDPSNPPLKYRSQILNQL